jgi:tetratricopeptide (TPR) repeat protein
MLAGYGLMTNELAPVDQALRLSPDDPDARVNRAALLSQRGEHGQAAAELERAAQLRPLDYYLWLELGMARDRMGDPARAELAFRESKRLAPYYAQPVWQLGNLLFRAGRQEEALGELSRAAKTDSTLVPAVIELTWAARSNATAVREMLKPQSLL